MDKYVPFDAKKQTSKIPKPAIPAIPAILDKKQIDTLAIPKLFSAIPVQRDATPEKNSSGIATNSLKNSIITDCNNSRIAKIAGIAVGSYPDCRGWKLADLNAWKRCLECEWAWWECGTHVCLDHDGQRVDRAMKTCRRNKR